MFDISGGMFSIQQLFGKTVRLYELIELTAVETDKNMQLLAKWLKSEERLEIPHELVHIQQNQRVIHAEIWKLLVTTSATDLGREDFESLVRAFFKISKATGKFADRFNTAKPPIPSPTFLRQVELMTKATDVVRVMAKQICKKEELGVIKQTNDQLHRIENEADGSMRNIRSELLSGRHDALRVLVLLDLYQLFEKVINYCADAGDLIMRIALKNS